jgi:hypothetical protein
METYPVYYACLCHLGQTCVKCGCDKHRCSSHCQSYSDGHDFHTTVGKFIEFSTMCMCGKIRWNDSTNKVLRNVAKCKGKGNTCPKARVFGNNGKSRGCPDCLTEYMRGKHGFWVMSDHGPLLKYRRGFPHLVKETKRQFTTLKTRHDKMKDGLKTLLMIFPRMMCYPERNVKISLYMFLR